MFLHFNNSSQNTTTTTTTTTILWLRYPRRICASLVVLLHPSLSHATCLQLTIPFFLMSFSTSTFHIVLGLPLGRFWSSENVIVKLCFTLFHHLFDIHCCFFTKMLLCEIVPFFFLHLHTVCFQNSILNLYILFLSHLFICLQHYYG
jgi:hypothetical protein